MLLKRRGDDGSPNPAKFTVGQAAELACHEPAPPGGDAEGHAPARGGNIARVLGRLVQVLHDEGTLDDGAVLQVVGDTFRAATGADDHAHDAASTPHRTAVSVE